MSTLTMLTQRTVLLYDDPPPLFSLSADADVAAAIELANNPILFNGANAFRRSRHNFYRGPVRALSAGDEIVEPIPPAVWRALRNFGFVFYRAVDAELPPRGEETPSSTPDLDYRRAPAVAVGEPPGTVRVFVGVI